MTATQGPRTAQAHSQTARTSNVPGTSRARWASAALIGAEALGFVALAALFHSGRILDAMWALQFVVAVAMMLAVLWAGARRRRTWSEPLAQLEALIPEVRDARQPIESLGAIGGRIAPLARLCQDLLRDLRVEQLRASEARSEIRQRVASRTDALERKIGVLRQQAARDALTGLFNRRMLDEYLPEAVARCRSSGAPLCLLMMDVDYFKPLNDTLGHAAGDQMLKSIGQVIRSTIRDSDVAFRCGGDEFVVILEGCPIKPAQAVAARIASLADALGRTFHVARSPRLSIGIASLQDLGAEPTTEALLQSADHALYRVKREHHGAAKPAARQSA